VSQFREHAVRIRARLFALGEAEEAQSSTGGLLRRCVGAMTRSDKGNLLALASRCLVLMYKVAICHHST
jgi:hypothetical protein